MDLLVGVERADSSVERVSELSGLVVVGGSTAGSVEVILHYLPVVVQKRRRLPESLGRLSCIEGWLTQQSVVALEGIRLGRLHHSFIGQQGLDEALLIKVHHRRPHLLY